MSRLTEHLLNEVKGDFGGFTEEELTGIIETVKTFGIRKVNIHTDGVTFVGDYKGADVVIDIVRNSKTNEISIGVKKMNNDKFKYGSNDLGRNLQSCLGRLLEN